MTENQKKAIKCALNIVAYAPCTAKGLCDKLSKKGYTKEEVRCAAQYLISKGYINETELLYRTVRLRAEQGYGRRRIYVYVKQKGFAPRIIEEHFDDACREIDFIRYCKKRIKSSKTDDPDKLLASLGRYGYEYSVIKKALQEEINEES